MKHSLTRTCPDCLRTFSFSFRTPIFGQRELVRVLIAYASRECELAIHTLDHANERVALFLDEYKREAEFLRDEAKRESYNESNP